MHSFQGTAAVVTAMFALAAAQSTSSTPSVNLFINDALDGDAAYAASIVTACADQTIYAIRCTSGPVYVEPSICGPDALVGSLILPRRNGMQHFHADTLRPPDHHYNRSRLRLHRHLLDTGCRIRRDRHCYDLRVMCSARHDGRRLPRHGVRGGLGDVDVKRNGVLDHGNRLPPVPSGDHGWCREDGERHGHMRNFGRYVYLRFQRGRGHGCRGCVDSCGGSGPVRARPNEAAQGCRGRIYAVLLMWSCHVHEALSAGPAGTE